VDRDELRRHPFETRGDRLGPGRATGDRDGSIPDGALVTGWHRDDDGPDQVRALERVERPREERPAAEIREGLRAAGPQPLAGAGGRDDR
jgi:hypothetical protein